MFDKAVISLLMGIVLLFLGRKAFWLFVGAAGFLLGIDIAQQYVVGPQATKVLIAILAGISGAVIAIFLKKAAIVLAGFIVGGLLTVEIMNEFAMHPAAFAQAEGMAISVPFVIGGVVGAALLFVFFDWALIALSSFIGAMMVAGNIVLQQRRAQPVLFVFLVAVGILVQAAMMRKSRNAG
jgi:hypothetical protein